MSDLNKLHWEARAVSAGQTFTKKHYGYVMLRLRLKWLPYVALGVFLAYCYVTGRNS